MKKQLILNHTVIQKFLDVEIHFGFSTYSVCPLHKNERYAWTGLETDLVKHSLPPTLVLGVDLPKNIIGLSYVVDFLGGARSISQKLC